ncbi:MAG: hypothetical protein E7611_07980 [Ruminococcaceae bacterium]|nr:hypothetical protein [Oscillospiraceae bacterium]
MNYRETYEATLATREDYVNGFSRVIGQRQAEIQKKRDEYVKNIFSDSESCREDFKKMLGWPLVEFEGYDMPEPECEHLSSEDGYDVYRMHFEVLEGFTLSGIFLKLKGEQKRPLVIAQHGGEGTPEVICGLLGDTENYNDMVQRVMKRGVHIFAPQLLLWRNAFGVPYKRSEIDAQLKNVGSSITAVEIYAITRVLDYFEKKDYVKNFGMVGLSYGGFYTLFTTAVETRIKSAISSSFFNSREAISWPDWTWKDLLFKFDDAEIACLCYPRKLYIAVGAQDALFDVKYARESFERVKELSADVGHDWVAFDDFEGVHEFVKTDGFIDKLIEDLT